MKKATVLILLSIFLVLFISPTTTNALSCAEIPTGEQGYAEYDGVIIGQVEDVVREKDNNVIKLKVIKSFKKIDVEQISVRENMTWGSLGRPSEVGEEYLYYLKLGIMGWENPLCSPTMNVADAAGEMAFLEDKEVPIKGVSDPSESPSETSGVPRISADDEINQVIKTNESIPKSTSMNWTGIVVVVVVLAVGVLFVLWRLLSARR